MALTLVITQNVEARYRGFLGSVMLEVSAGVYVSTVMNSGVRERLWSTLQEWHSQLHNGSVTMVWQSAKQPGGFGIKVLGLSPKTIVEVNGFLLTGRPNRL